VAGILGYAPLGIHRAEILAGDPQPHRRLGAPPVDVAVGAGLRDAAVPMGGAPKEGLGELAHECLRGRATPLALPQPMQGEGRRQALLEAALVGGGGGEGEKPLRGLGTRTGRPRQGQLVGIHAPLDVAVRFQPM
jgi:hypothetical protein